MTIYRTQGKLIYVHVFLIKIIDGLSDEEGIEQSLEGSKKCLFP